MRSSNIRREQVGLGLVRTQGGVGERELRERVEPDLLECREVRGVFRLGLQLGFLLVRKVVPVREIDVVGDRLRYGRGDGNRHDGRLGQKLAGVERNGGIPAAIYWPSVPVGHLDS